MFHFLSFDVFISHLKSRQHKKEGMPPPTLSFVSFTFAYDNNLGLVGSCFLMWFLCTLTIFLTILAHFASIHITTMLIGSSTWKVMNTK